MNTEPTQYIPAVKAVNSYSAEEEDEEDAVSGSKTRKMLALVGGILAAAAIIFALFHFIFGSFSNPVQTEFAVPNLLGKTMEEVLADPKISSVFTIEQIGQRASSEYPAGQIIEQTPEKGKSLCRTLWGRSIAPLRSS